MIKYKVKAKKQWTQKNRALVRDAVAFAVERFDLHDQDITIVLRGTNHKMSGYAINHYGKCIVALCCPLVSKITILDVIFHEFTHVHQYVSGKLKYTNDNDWMWNYIRFNKEDDFAYWRRPWEVEARSVAKILIREYLNK